MGDCIFITGVNVLRLFNVFVFSDGFYKNFSKEIHSHEYPDENGHKHKGIEPIDFKPTVFGRGENSVKEF